MAPTNNKPCAQHTETSGGQPGHTSRTVTILGLINSNMNKRDVQEGCANGLYRVCTQSSNTGDENMDVLQLTIL